MTVLTIPTPPGSPGTLSDFNNVNEALKGDILPRTSDSNGTATDLAANLGTATYPFNRMYVKVGFMAAGFMKKFYNFNGTLPLPAGYMFCNGDQVTQAAYNVQQRTSPSDTTDYWSAHVGSTSLQNLYLPNMTGRYTKGTTSPTQNGVAALTYAGNIGNQANLSHFHGVTLTGNAVHNPQPQGNNLSPFVAFSVFQHKHTINFPANLSATQSLRPESIEFRYIMRIVE